MTDLDTLGGSYAYGINNAGQIVGVSAVTGGTTSHAALWQNGTMTDLGTLPGTNESSASAINQAGEIVGYSEVFSGIDPHAALWRNGKIADLNSAIDSALGWTLEYGSDINDHGQIVGTGTIGGEQHGFLLTPSVAAPEPTTLALAALGLGTWCVVSPRRRRPMAGRHSR
jgi:probable HAF family extracellular repeat protein